MITVTLLLIISTVLIIVGSDGCPSPKSFVRNTDVTRILAVIGQDKDDTSNVYSHMLWSQDDVGSVTKSQNMSRKGFSECDSVVIIRQIVSIGFFLQLI